MGERVLYGHIVFISERICKAQRIRNFHRIACSQHHLGAVQEKAVTTQSIYHTVELASEFRVYIVLIYDGILLR